MPDSLLALPSFLTIVINRPENLILVTSREESLAKREEEEETRSTQRENKKMAAELSIEMFQDQKGSNGVTIYPRELSITWGDDKRYWKWFWILLESQDYKVVEIPRLIDVCWLEIKGKYEMSKLTPRVNYEVVFVLMMKEPIAGWTNSPVTFRLDLPDGTSQSIDMNLSNVPKDEWKALSIGEFKATKDVGDIHFSMKDIKSGWKKGIIIKNVVFRPAPFNYN